MKDNVDHISVLLKEAVNCLNIQPDGYYVDATYGRGGHACKILSCLGNKGRLLAIDRDPQAVLAGQAVKDKRFTMTHGVFADLSSYVSTEFGSNSLINGILFDLGVCSPQLDNPERGFSFLRDGPLDMRMDPSIGDPACVWLNQAKCSDISWVLKNFGDERFAKRIAQAIVTYRQHKPLTRTLQLVDLISTAVPKRDKHKHVATRSFQAIRIYINDELLQIQKALIAALELLAPYGRLVVVSFHSLEDRVIKRFMSHYGANTAIPPGLPLTHAQLLAKRKLQILPKIKPSDLEIKSNPRARSAVLRVAQRIA